MKKSPSAKSGKADLISLRKQIGALRKEVASVQKTIKTLRKPGKLRASKLVVDSLEVVDSTGKVVASIDNKGNLFCLTVWASTGRNKRGVFLDGKTFRSVSAQSLELIGLTGNTPGVEAKCWSSGGEIKVRSLKTKQLLRLQGNGAPLIAYDNKAGTSAAMLTTNSPAGGGLELTGTVKGSKAKAELRISHLSHAGILSLRDANGKIVGKLP